MKKREQGVLSVEASIVLTLMLLFVLFLFSFGRVYRAQNLMSHAALQSADAVALESYLRETALQADAEEVVYLANQITDSSAISADGLESLRSANLPEIARQKFISAIADSEAKADEKLRSMGIKDGVSGIDFSESKVDLTNDDVIIAITYTVEMQFPVFGYDEITVTKSAKAKTFGEILFEVSTKPNNPGWGTTSGDDKVVHGSTVQITATPKYGYKFVSWDDGNTDNPRTVTVTDAQHYTAIFEKDSFGINISKKIEYNQNYKGITHTDYGSFEGAGNYKYLDNATLVATPKSPNYQFKGWDINGDGVIDNTSKTINITVDKTYNSIKAVFKPATFKVSAEVNNSDYGTASVEQGSQKGKSITVEYGSKVKFIAVSKDSVKYSFDKWSNKNTEPSFNVNVSGKTTFTAEFKQNTYTVNFYNGSKKVHSTNVICNSSISGSKDYTGATMYDGKKIDRFVRWKKDGGSTFTSTTTVNSNINVYAALGCKITLDPNGGSVSWTTKTIEQGESITLPTPKLANHKFDVWAIAENRVVKGGVTVSFSKDTTLVAVWTCNHAVGKVIDKYEPYCSDIYSNGKLKSGAKMPYEVRKCETCGDTWKVTNESLRKHRRMDHKNGSDGDDFWSYCDEKHPDTHYGYCGSYSGNNGSKHRWDGHYHVMCSYCHKEEQGFVWCWVDGKLEYYNLHRCAKHKSKGTIPCPF